MPTKCGEKFVFLLAADSGVMTLEDRRHNITLGFANFNDFFDLLVVKIRDSESLKST
jgi:hypothetical protein